VYKYSQPPSSSSRPTHFSTQKRLGRPWAPPKNCSTKGGGFDLKSIGGELVESKKILFQLFNLSSFNGWLMSKLEFCFHSLPWRLSFMWSKLELSFEAISVD